MPLPHSPDIGDFRHFKGRKASSVVMAENEVSLALLPAPTCLTFGCEAAQMWVGSTSRKTDMAYSDDPDYRPTIGILLYPGYTLLDLAGPQIAIGNQGNTLLFWKDMNPVRGDNGPELVPTTTFAEYDGNIDVLLVPGGFGVEDAMSDPEIIGFLQRAAKTARVVSAACTGTLLLAAAGLLDGRKATTHWFAYEAIERNFPKIELVRNARVVTDGNVFTSGGVTAGIELGIRLLAEAKGDRVAATTELAMCYDPEPPFGTGSPSKAGPDLLKAAIKYAEKIGTEKLWLAAA